MYLTGNWQYFDCILPVYIMQECRLVMRNRAK